MISDLLTWEGWDDVDTFVFQYYNIKLLTQIGNFKPATEFEVATIDYDKGTITLWNSETEEYTYNLKLIVK